VPIALSSSASIKLAAVTIANVAKERSLAWVNVRRSIELSSTKKRIEMMFSLQPKVACSLAAQVSFLSGAAVGLVSGAASAAVAGTPVGSPPPRSVAWHLR
jgi:hypothetical protein